MRQAVEQGNFTLARSESEKLYRAWIRRPTDLWHWKFKLLNAEMLLLNGDTSAAQALLASPPPLKYSSLQPRYEMLRAYVAFRLNQDATAHALLRQAIRSAHEQRDFETEADSRVLVTAYATTESTADAQLFEDTLAFTRAHNLPYQSAAVLLNLGLLRIHQSHFADAIAVLQEAGDVARKVKASLLYSMITSNLATCYEQLGNFEQSIALRRQAIAVQKRAGLKTPLRDSYLELGSAQLEEGEVSEAILSFRSALGLVNERDAPGVYALIAENLASALLDEGDVTEADRLTQHAKTLLGQSDIEAGLWNLFTQASIAEHRGDQDRALACYLQVARASAPYPALAWSAEAAAARILSDKVDPESIRRGEAHYESALRAIESSRAEQVQSKYEITFLSQRIRFYQDYVRFLIRKGDITHALLVADSSRASVLGKTLTRVNSRDDPGLIGAVQRKLQRTHTAILFYFLANDRSYLWVITGRELDCVTLPGSNEIAAAVTSYQQAIEVDKADPLLTHPRQGRRLFDLLVTPALPKLAGYRRIIVIPDGALHHLNFETLVTGDTHPHYWIEDATLAIAPSLNLLDSPITVPAFSASLLSIGDPRSPAPDYAPLEFASDELNTVQAHFPAERTTSLRGLKAVPSAFRSAHPERFRFIHVAAHAESNERSPLDSAIILSPDRDGYRLYARDIMQTPLRADLVVLSACRSSGSRTYSGEGSVGFAWALFEAGAHNVLASLWDANDRLTASLMNSFYDSLDQGEDYAEALHTAKLKMIRKNSRPYFWAPFQIYVRSLPNK